VEEYEAWHVPYLHCEVSPLVVHCYLQSAIVATPALVAYTLQSDIDLFQFDSKWKLWLVVFLIGVICGHSKRFASSMSQWAVFRNVHSQKSPRFDLRNQINGHLAALMCSLILGTLPLILYMTSDAVYKSRYGDALSIPLQSATMSSMRSIVGLLTSGFDYNEGVRKLFQLDAKQTAQRRVARVTPSILDETTNDTMEHDLEKSLQREIEFTAV
jgi:hypothetical protein